MEHETFIFDNHDSRIRYYRLQLECSLDHVLQYDLPDGFRFVFYRDGDRDQWIAIEQSAKEFTGYDQGLAAWNKYYGGREADLYNRMIFIENEAGEKVATATALYDIYGEDKSGSAWLHWVSVRREYQGKGLSKPLVSHALHVMRELGYTRVKLTTQTTTWLACKIYLDFGFRPSPQNAVESEEGWKIIKALTKHPALSEFGDIPVSAVEGEA